ncbi:MAG: CBASS cGAMP-activated phospholipase [Magnetovibrionaceae bacterium]
MQDIASESKNERPFQILSLSGGGFLGLFSALLLEKLEDRFGSPLANHFDLICGTSVGGIIALGLAAEESASDIRKALEMHGPRIFPTPFKRSLSLFRPMYKPEPLRDAIIEIVGQTMVLGDLQSRVLVPTVNLTKGGPSIFKTPHHPDLSENWRRTVVEVAMATSAAPTMFPTAVVGHSTYTDGGLFANSPDLLGALEAEKFLGVERGNISVLSIGTTTNRFSFESGDNRKGILPWLAGLRVFNVMISSQQQAVHHMMEHSYGDRYVRLDYEPSPEQSKGLRLDIANRKSIDTQKGLAETVFQNAIPDRRLMSFFETQAPKPTFFHGPQASGQM